MLTNLRYFGFIINPITCYYCFDETGEKIETIVAEVTNTPWKQRCHYVLAIDEEQQQRGAQHVFFTKEMHVSPFQPVHLNSSSKNIVSILTRLNPNGLSAVIKK